MFTITKQFSFSAAHDLPLMPEGHQCKRLHGHNYRVEVVLASAQLDDLDMVYDYGKMDFIGNWLKATFDHQYLNEVFHRLGWEGQTTAENLAQYLYQVWGSGYTDLSSFLYAVRVSETDKTWAEYREQAY